MKRYLRSALAVSALALVVSACTTTPDPVVKEVRDGGPERPIDLSHVADAVPRDEPRSRYGNPKSYVVFGKRYHVMDSAEGFVQRGIASWYGTKFHGRRTSSGEPYDMYAMTAAHKELPLPSYVEVTNLKNGRKAIVRVNDRGPFKEGRIIDLSYAAAHKLGVVADGTAPVEIRVLSPGQTTPAVQHVNAGTVVEPKFAYYIQAGAFADRRNADRLRVRIDATSPGVPVTVESTEAGSAVLHRVRLGPLTDVAQVDRLIESLSEAGIANAQVIVVD